MKKNAKHTSAPGRPGVLGTLLVCLAVLLAGGVGAWLLFATEPTAQREGATRRSAMLVDVVEAERGTYRPVIVSLGRVEPAREIALRPRVSGEVAELADGFTPGGFVSKGDWLLKIDPVDYRIALDQRQSELLRAQADLDLEMGRQNVARQDFELLDESISAGSESLILRKPQLEATRAQVRAAEAAVTKAKLDLERTTIKAPFDAMVLERHVNVGAQVAVGDDLGQLVGIGEYWVVATVPLSKIRWLSFADEDGRGSATEIRNRSSWAPGASRSGTLERLIGTLDETTRLARVLVTVPDPLAREDASRDLPPMILGAVVEVRIEGRELEGVVRIDRDFLRTGDKVWTMVDGKLRIRDVDVVFRDAEHAYIQEGLEDGALVVTTNLSAVVDGADLRTGQDDPEAGEGQ